MSKRRLNMLPEVLPDPTTFGTPGSPRQRTLEHMRRLLAVSLAATAGLACSKEDQVAIRPEDPSKLKKAPDPEPKPATTATTTASGTSTVPSATAPIPTYAVVDPLPPPAACFGLAASIKATASWKKTAGSVSFLELTLPKPGRADAKYGKTPTTTPVYGGKLLSITAVGAGLTVQVIPDPTAKDVYVYVEAECSAGKERVYASMSFSTVGGPIAVTLSDVW